MTNKKNSWIFEEFRNNYSYYNYVFLTYNNLVFTFFEIFLNLKLSNYGDGLMVFMLKKL